MASQDNDMIDDVEENKSNGDVFDHFSDHILNSLYRSNKYKNKNLILSPLSILIAMTVCMAGSDKETLKEMINVLYPGLKAASTPATAKKKAKEILALCDHYNKEFGAYKGSKPVIKLANKVWVKKGFEILESYRLICRKSNVESIDLSDKEKAADIVNKWCAENTNNMIKKVVTPDEMTPAIRLLIANAIYFNGKFERPFPKKNTMKDTKFWADKTRKKEICKVFMMCQFEKLFFRKGYKSSNEDEGKYDVVKLKYKGSDLSLILALNDYSTQKKQLLKEKDLKGIKWKFDKLKLYVPRFKFEFGLSLTAAFRQMGMNKAFSGAADFSGMTGKKNLVIDEVIHKAVIDVDEEGTEAAAVTVVKMKKRSAKRNKVEPPTIRMDHPLSFYVFDEENGIVLFCGVYNGSKN